MRSSKVTFPVVFTSALVLYSYPAKPNDNPDCFPNVDPVPVVDPEHQSIPSREPRGSFLAGEVVFDRGRGGEGERERVCLDF